MTSWHRNEYILKGLFLGLWAFVALQVAVDTNGNNRLSVWVNGALFFAASSRTCAAVNAGHRA